MNKNEPLIVHDQQIYGSELICSIFGEIFLWEFDKQVSECKKANGMLQNYNLMSSFSL